MEQLSLFYIYFTKIDELLHLLLLRYRLHDPSMLESHEIIQARFVIIFFLDLLS